MSDIEKPEIFSLKGKKILVTGAAGHVGQELCRYLLADGATVFAVDSDQKRLDLLDALVPRSGATLVSFCVDLSDEQQRIDLLTAVEGKTDSLDGAVLAAAFVGTSDLAGWAVDFAEQSLSTWRKVFELNLTAPFHLAQLFAPLLRRGQCPSIVNIGSIYGSLGPDWGLYEGLDISNPAAYSASKGGLSQLTRWLTSTLAPEVRVNTVSPGGIARGQAGAFIDRYSAKTPLRRMAKESDLVGPIVFCLSEAASYLTGQNIVVDGGYSSL